MNTNTNAAPALREAFEHHWYDTYHSGYISVGEDGRYWPPEVQKSWEAWQACAALSTAAQPPAGWVPMPAEPTLEMGWAYLDAAREQDPLSKHIFNHAGYRAMVAAAQKAIKTSCSNSSMDCAAAPKAEPVQQPVGDYPPLWHEIMRYAEGATSPSQTRLKDWAYRLRREAATQSAHKEQPNES